MVSPFHLRLSFAALLFALVGLSSAPVAAQPAPRSESDPCRGRHPDDPCQADDFEGTCRRRRCTRETDDGIRSFHCLVCEIRHHGHHSGGHRHRGLLDAGLDDAVAAPSDDVSDASVVSEDAPTRADATTVHPPPRRTPPTAPPREGLFSCAAVPRSRGGGVGAWALVAVAWASCFRRRARSAPSP